MPATPAGRRRAPWQRSWRAAAAAVPLLLVAAATLTACGGTGTAATAASTSAALQSSYSGPSYTAPPSSAAATTTPAGATPTGPYIAVVNGQEFDFYDPSTGAKLASRTVADDLYRLTGLPGGTAPGGVRGSFSAGTGTPSFNGDLTRVAGLDSYGGGGDTVPAYLDLATGAVSDVVAPTDHSGFAKTDPVTYVQAAYNPANDDLWGLQFAGDPHNGSGTYTLTGPGGATSKYTWQGILADAAMSFALGGSRPSVLPGQDEVGSVQPEDPPVPDDAQYLSPDVVGQTNFQVGTIRRPDSGKPGGAFLAQPPNGAQYVLMVWDGSSTPRQVVTVPEAEQQPGDTGILFQVLRYKDS